MDRTIPGWTDLHRRVAGALSIVVGASLAGLLDAPAVAIWVAVAVAATAVVALALDEFGGFLVGLAAAAALIAVRRAVGPWGPDAFWLSLLQTLAVVATGVVSSRTGRALRAPGVDEAPSLLPEPVFGSLGLLHGAVAMDRLAEEVERAADHRRPLSLVLVHVEVTEAALDPDARRSALRSVARIFEGRLRDGDVPFATAADSLGAVLPETTSAGAWDRVGLVLDAVNDGTFTARSDGLRRSLADAVQIDVGLAQLGPRLGDAGSLYDAATTALRRNQARHAAMGEEGLR
jgi:GGDEF domain-containing protein